MVTTFIRNATSSKTTGRTAGCIRRIAMLLSVTIVAAGPVWAARSVSPPEAGTQTAGGNPSGETREPEATSIAPAPGAARGNESGDAAASLDAAYYKQLGDAYVAEESIEAAAGAYERALSLDRTRFGPDERVRMAVYISWAGRLESAVQELGLVLSEDPAHAGARVHLARVYAWQGELERSLAEADRVLAGFPDHAGALLVKADVRSWQERFDEAIPIYAEVAERSGDVNAEIGLASALLLDGDRAAARRRIENLTPANPAQERDLEELAESIDRQTSPRIDMSYSVYSDSDDNRFARYSALYGFTVGNQDFELSLGRTDGGGGTPLAEDFSLGASLRPSPGFGLGFGLGLRRLGTEPASQFPTGRFRIDGEVSGAAIGVTASSEILAETAELTESRVRRTTAGVELSGRLGGRILLGGAYHHMNFSDGNRASSVAIESELSVSGAPRLAIGYRLRFTDFDRQSGSGFFDPDSFRSHRLFGSLYLERSRLFAYVDAYVGRQEFVRYGFRNQEWTTGGSASVGFLPAPNLTLELNASGGNFALGSISGFRYLTLGSRVSYRF